MHDRGVVDMVVAAVEKLSHRVTGSLPVHGAILAFGTEVGPVTLAGAESSPGELSVNLQATYDEGPILDALMTGQCVSHQRGEVHVAWPRFGRIARLNGLAGLVALPVMIETTVIGVVELAQLESVRLWPDELALAAELVDDIRVALLRALEDEGSRSVLVDHVMARHEHILQAQGALMMRAEVGAARALDQLRERASHHDLTLTGYCRRFLDERPGCSEVPR